MMDADAVKCPVMMFDESLWISPASLMTWDFYPQSFILGLRFDSCVKNA